VFIDSGITLEHIWYGTIEFESYLRGEFIANLSLLRIRKEKSTHSYRRSERSKTSFVRHLTFLPHIKHHFYFRTGI